MSNKKPFVLYSAKSEMPKKSILRSLIFQIQKSIKGLGSSNKKCWESFSPFNEITINQFVSRINAFNIFLTESEAKEIWKLIGIQNNLMKYPEFLRLLYYSFPALSGADDIYEIDQLLLNNRRGLLPYFQELDPNETGFITHNSFTYICQKLSSNISQYQMNDLIYKYDPTNSGLINYYHLLSDLNSKSPPQSPTKPYSTLANYESSNFASSLNQNSRSFPFNQSQNSGPFPFNQSQNSGPFPFNQSQNSPTQSPRKFSTSFFRNIPNQQDDSNINRFNDLNNNNAYSFNSNTNFTINNDFQNPDDLPSVVAAKIAKSFNNEYNQNIIPIPKGEDNPENINQTNAQEGQNEANERDVSDNKQNTDNNKKQLKGNKSPRQASKSKDEKKEIKSNTQNNEKEELKNNSEEEKLNQCPLNKIRPHPQVFFSKWGSLTTGITPEVLHQGLQTDLQLVIPVEELKSLFHGPTMSLSEFVNFISQSTPHPKSLRSRAQIENEIVLKFIAHKVQKHDNWKDIVMNSNSPEQLSQGFKGIDIFIPVRDLRVLFSPTNKEDFIQSVSTFITEY